MAGGAAMLVNTFCHIPSVGPVRERELWALGVECWDDLSRAADLQVAPHLLGLLEEHIPLSRESLLRRDAGFFRQCLPSCELWRVFREFRDGAAYLDIETTGLYPGYHGVTTIALYDGREARYYVAGRNLEEFREDILRYPLLVTFNGVRFDLPFLETCLGAEFPQLHIDLRYVLKSLGYRGGLKAIERRLGIDRAELDGVDGYFAVLLWREYERTGNPRALETLLAYNIEDVVNLEKLMVMAYNRKLAETPFLPHCPLDPPSEPARPFEPDAGLIARLRGRVWGGPGGNPGWQG